MASLLAVTQCTDVPTLSTENPIDPYRADYKPPAPQNFSVSEPRYSSNNRLEIRWTINPSEAAGISGYTLLLDKFGYGEYQEVPLNSLDTENKNSETFEYRISMPIEDEVLAYDFKLFSFFDNGVDTVYSETMTAVYDNLPYTEVNIDVHPFQSEPYLYLNFYSENPDFIYKVFSISMDSTLNLLAEGSKQDLDELKIPLDVESEFLGYFYTITSGGYRTGLREAYAYVNSFDVYPEIRSTSLNDLTLSFNIYEDSSNYDPDTGEIVYTPNYTADQLDVTIMKSTTNDSTVIFSGVINGLDEELTLSGLDESDILISSVRAKRGVYETAGYTYEIFYAPTKQNEFSVKSGSLERVNGAEIQIDEEFGYVYLSDKRAGLSNIIDLNTKTLRTHAIVNDWDRLSVGKFLSNRVSGTTKSVLFATTDTDSISKIDINGIYDREETVYKALDGYYAHDIAILSESELLIVNLIHDNPQYQHLVGMVITRFNTESKEHIPIYSTSGLNKYAVRLKYDSSNNRAFITTYRSNVSGGFKILEIDLSTNQTKQTTAPYFRISMFAPDLLKDGSIISLGNNDYIQLLSSESGQVIYSYGSSRTSDPIIMSLNTTDSGSLMCESFRGRYSNSTYEVSIQCNTIRFNGDPINEIRRYNYYEFNGYESNLYTTALSESGNTLAILFTDELRIITFEPNWQVGNYSSYYK
jgi:hypothetical protein